MEKKTFLQVMSNNLNPVIDKWYRKLRKHGIPVTIAWNLMDSIAKELVKPGHVEYVDFSIWSRAQVKRQREYIASMERHFQERMNEPQILINNDMPENGDVDPEILDSAKEEFKHSCENYLDDNDVTRFTLAGSIISFGRDKARASLGDKKFYVLYQNLVDIDEAAYEKKFGHGVYTPSCRMTELSNELFPD